MENEVSAADLSAMLEEALPAGPSYFQMTAAGTMERGGHLFAVLRTLHWDVDEASGEHSIRDVKEQEVLLVPAMCRDSRARVGAYVRAWAAALNEVLALAENAERLGGLMPSDLVHAKVLNLARAETEEDFRKALLVKSRLGGLPA